MDLVFGTPTFGKKIKTTPAPVSKKKKTPETPQTPAPAPPPASPTSQPTPTKKQKTPAPAPAPPAPDSQPKPTTQQSAAPAPAPAQAPAPAPPAPASQPTPTTQQSVAPAPAPAPASQPTTEQTPPPAPASAPAPAPTPAPAKRKRFTSEPRPENSNPEQRGKPWKSKLSPYGKKYVLGEKETSVSYYVCWEHYRPRSKLCDVPITVVNPKTKKKTTKLPHQWAAGNGIAGKVIKFTKSKTKSALPMNTKKFVFRLVCSCMCAFDINIPTLCAGSKSPS